MAKTPSKTKAKKAAAPVAKKAAAGEVAPRGTFDDFFAGFADMRREMDRLFNEMSADFGLFPHRLKFPSIKSMPAFKSVIGAAEPKVDVTENDKAITVTAELPGMEEKDVNVSVGDGYISISGEKKSEKEEKTKTGYLQERSYGSFHRSFRLPDTVDADKISADLAKGVLTVTLPKTASAAVPKTRKVAVKAK